MATKRTANGKPVTKKAAGPKAAKTGGRRGAAPRVLVDGELNPDHCYYDPAKGVMVVGLDVFDGAGWETVLVKFELLMADEVGWLERALADARAAVGSRGAGP
jgi:hypothetical protein